MKANIWIRDIICQIVVDYKSTDLIYSILNEFIPRYQNLSLDYVGKPSNEDYIFKSEDEMLRYYVDTLKVDQTFYWNKYENNENKIMVGVCITEDDKMVFSLTFNGGEETKDLYFNKLKRSLNSDIGIVSYVNPVMYKDGADFKNKCRQVD